MLQVLILSSEITPFARTGQIADAVAELARALRALGHDVRVAMPRYGRVNREWLHAALDAFPVPLDAHGELAAVLQGTLEPGIPVYFIENARLFDREGIYLYPDDAERFIFFSRAALEMLPRLGWQPDIIHANDWQTALVPNWLKTIYASAPFFQRTASVYTIHNLAYQGVFDQRVLDIAGLTRYGVIAHPEVPRELNDAVDFMARGILFADALNTVSATYAREIQTAAQGEKLDPILRMRAARLRGILNGIDYHRDDPAADLALPQRFDAEHLSARAENKRALQGQAGLAENPTAPLLAMVAPLEDEQGYDLVEDVIDHLLALDIQFLVVGAGDAHYRKVFADLHAQYPKQVAAFFNADDALVRRVMAGSDMLLLPARFAPDTTTQLLALHYGCVPIVRAVGSLADAVADLEPATGRGTGFVFQAYERWALFAAVVRALESYRRPDEWRALQQRGMAQDFSWRAAAGSYVEMYDFALDKQRAAVEREAHLAREIARTAQIMATLPERIAPLRDLVYNLWWSWHPDALALFEKIDAELWMRTNHNPVKLLRQVTPQHVRALAEDADFVAHYDRVMSAFRGYMHPSGTWFASTYPYASDRTVAYFSAEFGLHESLPIYSGGLGVLAGDHTKESSDLGVPLVGVGFLYPQGYFRQELDAWGNQNASYDKLNFAEAPAVPARDEHGKEIVISVDLPGRKVYAKVWQIQVGRVPLYLMDTDVEANAETDRELSARLYGGDHEMRIMQEIVLGIGGVRVLRALGLHPSAYHMNEGHSTFLILELRRELAAQGARCDEAAQIVNAHAIFTVHTPVAAGNDAFSPELMDKYFGAYYPLLGISRDEFLNLARQDHLFSMTVLGLRGAGQRNGVSRLHGQVSRELWRSLWWNRTVDQVPIGHITNGVHTATWLAPELNELYARVLGAEWYAALDQPQLWAQLRGADAEWWRVHVERKHKLVEYVRARVAQRLERLRAPRAEIDAARQVLNPDALTLGFARRFATYKRAVLLFRDSERLKRLLNHPERPLQIIFAGKAHPADEPGKDLIRQVLRHAQAPGFTGRVVFLEDYGMDDARFLVSGVDVWLNNPRRPLEASGTSGEKAALNGILNLSIADGWWAEGYNGANGWVIGDPNRVFDSHDAQDWADAQALYDLLETQVVPLYYERGADGLPRGWAAKAVEAIRTLAPAFSARRMVKEYVARYLNAMIP